MTLLTPVTDEESEMLDDEFSFMLTTEAFVMVDSKKLDETFVMLATVAGNGPGYYNKWYRFRFIDPDKNASSDAYSLAHALASELEEVRD